MIVTQSSIGRLTTGATTGTPAWEFIAPNFSVRIIELSIYLAAATASAYGLGRPAAKGITPTSPVDLLNEYGNESTTYPKTALAWGTAPTIPVQFFRQVTFPATVGSYVVWLFPRGLFVPANQSVVVWNSAANGVAYINVVAQQSELQ